MVDSKKLISYLIEWTFNYLKNKDILLKNIVSIERNKGGLHVTFKNREEFFIIKPIITNVEEIIQEIREKQSLTLITLNSKENFKFLVDNWKRFIDYQQFTVIFINPFSSLDKKWSINPYTHYKICDDASLKNGLKSMFNTVEPITEEDLQNLIRNTRK